MAATEQTSPLGERVSRIEGGYEHLATKADIARVETDLAQMKAELRADVGRVETDLAQMKADLKSDIGRMDGDLGGLRGEIDALRSEMRGVKWWIASAAAAVVALSGLAQLLPLGG